MINPLPDEVLAAQLLPLIDHPDPVVVELAAQAAVAAGAPTVEIALRHPRSLDALRRAAAAVDVPVGAGTVTHADQVGSALGAGAAYLVSPAGSVALVAAVSERGAPWLPCAATPTEVLALRDHGANLVKLFPAAALGGPTYVRAIASVATGVRFVPTGGIREHDAHEYLAIDSVAAVGGSWMFDALRVGADPTGVTNAVRAAVARTSRQ